MEPLQLHPTSNGYPEQVSASGLPVPDEAVVSPTSAKALRLRGRTRRKKTNQRVTWDEKAIAEHDKERGTRQKIDEPDTPFIRSPQTASDSEGGAPLSSDDEQRRLSIRSPILIPGLEAGKQNPRLVAMPTRSPAEEREVNAGAIADRLNDWVLNGELQRDRKRSGDTSSRGDVSSSGDEAAKKISNSGSCDADPKVRRNPKPGGERRISLSEDSPVPKPSSDNFKAKRANHYNEVAAMKAFKTKGGPVLSDPESDTSDEEKQDGRILTNTNTNKNMNPGRNRGRLDSESGPSSTGGSFSAASDAAAAPDATRGQEAPAGDKAAASSATAASAESAAPSAASAAAASAGAPPGAALAERSPGVVFGSSGPGEGSPKKKSSAAEEAAWKAKRNAHYNEMAKALRRLPPPSDEDSDSSSAED
mmetsp:Transcript_141502/g.257173  ORF Transcript_141502/g.257173 Transcript_141502/m.257173 type:complete len:420 (+) Transcript_141502:169-1428(+)